MSELESKPYTSAEKARLRHLVRSSCFSYDFIPDHRDRWRAMHEGAQRLLEPTRGIVDLPGRWEHLVNLGLSLPLDSHEILAIEKELMSLWLAGYDWERNLFAQMSKEAWPFIQMMYGFDENPNPLPESRSRCLWRKFCCRLGFHSFKRVGAHWLCQWCGRWDEGPEDWC